MLYFLVLVSLFGGYLVRIYAWRSMLGRDGVVNSFLISTHIISAPLSFLLNSNFAIVIALLNFLIPLGVLPIFSAMQNISPRLLEAAEDLGDLTDPDRADYRASPHHPGESGLPSRSASLRPWPNWVTPQLLGGPLDQFVGNQILYEFGETLNWPLGAAIALTL